MNILIAIADMNRPRARWRWVAACGVAAAVAGGVPAWAAEAVPAVSAASAGAMVSAGTVSGGSMSGIAASVAPVTTESGGPSLARQVPAALQGAWRSVAQGVTDVPAELSVLEQGTASFLWNGLQGRRTASGERYNMNELTAAHKTLPFGTQVIVRSLDTGREVLVRIIDRGPYLKDRVIDLSRAAAQALGIQSRGVSEVQVIPVQPAP